MAATPDTAMSRAQLWAAEQVAALKETKANQARVPFVRQVLPAGGVGAELGVFKGRFSSVLLRHAKPAVLHLVDPWDQLTPAWHWGEGDRSTANALRRVRRRWRQEIAAGRVVVHVGDDRAVLRDFADQSLDWAYVDSSHAYEHTLEELALLHHKVRHGGVIAGDDWQPDPAHRHHGVYRAVTEFAAEHGYQVAYADHRDQQWAIARPRP